MNVQSYNENLYYGILNISTIEIPVCAHGINITLPECLTLLLYLNFMLSLYSVVFLNFLVNI